MILAVDDTRACWGADIVVRNASSAVSVLASGLPIRELWLDHDLGLDSEGKTCDIRPVIRWIEETSPAHHDGLKIRILSSNPVGRAYIRQALSRYFEVYP